MRRIQDGGYLVGEKVGKDVKQGWVQEESERKL